MKRGLFLIAIFLVSSPELCIGRAPDREKFPILGKTALVPRAELAAAIAAARGKLNSPDWPTPWRKIARVVIESRTKVWVVYGVPSASFGQFLVVERIKGKWVVTGNASWIAGRSNRPMEPTATRFAITF